MIDRFQLAVAMQEIRHRILMGEHYLATGLALGVYPTDDDVEKAAKDLLLKRAKARQKGEIYAEEVRSYAGHLLQTGDELRQSARESGADLQLDAEADRAEALK